jgi:hypothetical protein
MKSTARLNVILDLISQINILLMQDFYPQSINNQMEILEALVFRELKRIEQDNINA